MRRVHHARVDLHIGLPVRGLRSHVVSPAHPTAISRASWFASPSTCSAVLTISFSMRLVTTKAGVCSCPNATRPTSLCARMTSRK
jgi:hypothetical protein